MKDEKIERIRRLGLEIKKRKRLGEPITSILELLKLKEREENIYFISKNGFRMLVKYSDLDKFFEHNKKRANMEILK